MSLVLFMALPVVGDTPLKVLLERDPGADHATYMVGLKLQRRSKVLTRAKLTIQGRTPCGPRSSSRTPRRLSHTFAAKSTW